MNIREVGIKSLAGLLALTIGQPTLVWNNPNLYLSVGLLVLANQVFNSIRMGGIVEPRQYFQYGLGLAVISVGMLGPAFSGFEVNERNRILDLTQTRSPGGLPVLNDYTVPLVSRDSAMKALARKLDEAGLGTTYQLGSPVKEAFQGRLVWVAPLEVRNRFSALLGVGAPAYAIVDANDIATARLVDYDIAVSDRTLIGLDERVWFRHPTLEVYGWYLELDDGGRPHWIGILVERKVGFRGYDVVGVVAVDVTSGTQTIYQRDDVPLWVNNKFPMEMVSRQISVAGASNQDGRFMLSSILNMVYFEKRAWYLATISDVDNPDAIVEVVLVDTVTRDTRRVPLKGITMSRAAQLLESSTKIPGLHAANPVPYLVGNIPAYVASLSDEQGYIRAYGVVSVSDGKALAVDETLHGALHQFYGKKSFIESTKLPPMTFDMEP